MKTKRFISILLALCLGLGMVFAAGFSVSAEDTPAAPEVTVVISAQINADGFILAPQEITVSADLSESLGFDDDFDGEEVSLLDAVVAAHILVFGEEDAADNFAMAADTGFFSKLMGVATNNVGFFVNDEVTDDVPLAEAIEDGDVISLVVYQDSMGLDMRAWFVVDEEDVTALTVDVGDTVEFLIRGLAAAGWGSYGGPARPAVPGTGIVPVTLAGVGATFGDPLATTDEDGLATIEFDAVGTFILSAIDVDNEWDIPLISPWLVVTVIDPVAIALDAAKTTRIAAINAVAASLTEADYTAESWAALQSAITTAIAAVNAAATVDAVNAVALPSADVLVTTAAAELAAAKTVRIAAINAVAAGLNQSNYTAASWAALQSAITAAITAVNAAATVAAVNAVALPSTGGLVESTNFSDWSEWLGGTWLGFMAGLPTILLQIIYYGLFGWLFWFARILFIVNFR